MKKGGASVNGQARRQLWGDWGKSDAVEELDDLLGDVDGFNIQSLPGVEDEAVAALTRDD